jgi:hypothetical protein
MEKKPSVESQRDEKLHKAMRRREILSKIRLWAYIVWLIGLFLIMARYLKLFPD